MIQKDLFSEPVAKYVSSSGITPRPYQQDAIDASFEGFETGDGCLVRLPTGSGKTIVGSLIAERWIQQSDMHHVMVVAHERQLIWQFAEEIEDVTGIEPGIEMAQRSIHSWAMPKIVIASRATLLDRSVEDEDGREVPCSRLYKFDANLHWLVIWDEAHKHAYGLRTVKHIVDWFAGNIKSKRLGLTATPERTDKRSLAKMFPVVASDYRLYDMAGGPCAVNDGWAVPYDQRFITVDGVDFQGIREVAGDFDKSELDAVLRQQENLAQLCEPMHELVGNRRTLIFCVTVEMTKEVARYLNAKEGCTVAKYLHGSIPEEERKIVYAEHKRDGFQYLVVCGLCVSKGTLVLTDIGEVPIEDVTSDMKLWDGVEFVSHDGVISKGVKPVIEYAGLIATGEHNVWTDDGWRSLADCKQQGTPIKVSAVGGRPVQESDGYYWSGGKTWQKSSIRSPVFRLWKSFHQGLSPNKKRRIWLYVLHFLVRCAELAVDAVSFCKEAMRKLKRQTLQGLWWSWNRVSVFYPGENGVLDYGESWALQGINDRPQEQCRPLRTGEHQMVQPGRTSEQSQTKTIESRTAPIQESQPNRSVFGCLPSETSERERVLLGSDCRTMEVFDILNSGPRSRFTANGKIISNCREGYNDPGIAAVAVFRPTKSRPLAEQMKGRGCRPLKGIVDGLHTAAERTEAIADSDKPNCMIVDMVGVTGLGDCASTAHIYANGLPDEVVDLANKKAVAADGPVDMPELLEDAAAEIRQEKEDAEQREANRRAKLKAKVSYDAQHVGQGGGTGITRRGAKGDGILTFGKHKGKKITDAPESYQSWMKKEMPYKYWPLIKACTGETKPKQQSNRQSIDDINRMFDEL